MSSLADIEQLKQAPKIAACFVDLDNTLWSGTLAEGQEPKLYPERYEVLKMLHGKGVQVYIVSKNDRTDVDEAFAGLKIDPELFTWVIANWDPKFVNVERLLHVCEIRPETAVFLDDNSFERNEVKQKIPAIHVLDAADFETILSVPSVAAKHIQGHEEIAERKNRYRTAIKTDFLKQEFAGTDRDFYRKLKREIRIGLVSADNLDRVMRLLVETHRLNFNPGKFTDYDKAVDYVHQRFNAGDRVYAMAALESGLSLGLTGALIVQIGDGVATIADGSFSCGIIGRDFEPKTILVLIEALQKEGVSTLKINFILTATNVRLKDIVEGLGFVVESKTVDKEGNLHLVYSLNIHDYVTAGRYDWILVSDQPPAFEYLGHPFVIDFFEKYVKPLFAQRAQVANLGSARGEVLGLLQANARETFYRFIKERNVNYTKVDMEYLPDEKNLVANAENLSAVFADASQDVVMAIELL